MYVLFNIGGTNMRVGVGQDGEVLDTKTVKTPQDFEEGMKQFVEIAKELAGDVFIQGVVGGVAGPLSRTGAHLTGMPNLPGWVKKPLRDRLQNELRAPVHLANDGVVEGIGEAVYGAGRGYKVVGYIIVGTGVGGCKIVNGVGDINSFGSEPGHQYVPVEVSEVDRAKGYGMCGCGGPYGHLEAFISGSAVKKRFGIEPYEIHDPVVWEELAETFAIGLSNVAVHWSPEVFVVGGSMVLGNPAIPLDRVAHHLKQKLTIFPEVPELKKSELGSESGFYGALAIAEQRFGV